MKRAASTCAHCKKPLLGRPLIPGYHDSCAKERISTALANEALEKVSSRPGLMRLRLIKHITFARSEETNFDAVKASLRGQKLDRHDVVLFVSLTQNQVMFVYSPTSVEVRPGIAKDVIRSVRFRLRGRGAWNPLMLANYASECGIKLDGLKRFEEHYEKLAHTAARSVAKRLGVERELKAA